LLAEIVPLTALLCLAPITMLMRFRWGKMFLGALAAVAFLVNAMGVYHKPNWEARVDLEHRPEMLWSWSQAPFMMALDPKR
jgi:hypothetical protein